MDLRAAVTMAWRLYRRWPTNDSNSVAVYRLPDGGYTVEEFVDQHSYIPDLVPVLHLVCPRQYNGDPAPERMLLREALAQAAITAAINTGLIKRR